MTPLRVGIVGYGLAGAGFHAPLIDRVDGLQITGIATANAARIEQAHAEHPGAAVVASLAELLELGVDLVVLASPNDVHATQARTVLEAGANVVVDKPVAPTADEVCALGEVALRTGLIAAAFHNRRWDGDFLTVRAAIDDGSLGTVRRVESRYETWAPMRKGGWRESGDPAVAPGLLYDLGSHLIDQAIVLFGLPNRVYAETLVRRDGVHAPDDVFVALTHDDDVVCHLWMSKVAAAPAPRFRVHGSAAGLVIDGPPSGRIAGVADRPDPGQTARLVSGDAPARPVTMVPGRPVEFYEQLEQALRGVAPTPVTLGEATDVISVVEAAARSASAGRVVILH